MPMLLITKRLDVAVTVGAAPHVAAKDTRVATNVPTSTRFLLSPPSVDFGAEAVAAFDEDEGDGRAEDGERRRREHG